LSEAKRCVNMSFPLYTIHFDTRCFYSIHFDTRCFYTIYFDIRCFRVRKRLAHARVALTVVVV